MSTFYNTVKLNHLFFNFKKKRNLIIHHGLMGSHKNFRNISKHPNVSNYANSYLIDARNHGQSPHTQQHQIFNLADDLARFISQNNITKKITLMGHSMGGLTLMQFTKRHYNLQNIIDRVIIVDVPTTNLFFYKSYQGTKQMLQALFKINMKQSLQDINKDIQKVSLSPSLAGLFKGQVMSENEQKKWRVNLKVLANNGVDKIGRYSLSENNPKKWFKPVQVIYGDKSGYFDENQERQFKSWYPQITNQNFHKVSNSGHWVHFEQPQQFLQIMQTILKRDQQSK